MSDGPGFLLHLLDFGIKNEAENITTKFFFFKLHKNFAFILAAILFSPEKIME